MSEEGDDAGDQMALSAGGEAEGEPEGSTVEERAASVRERGSRAEFAVRRGGKRPPPPRRAARRQRRAATPAEEEKSVPVPVAEVEEVAAAEPPKAEPPKAEPPKKRKAIRDH